MYIPKPLITWSLTILTVRDAILGINVCTFHITCPVSQSRNSILPNPTTDYSSMSSTSWLGQKTSDSKTIQLHHAHRQLTTPVHSHYFVPIYINSPPPSLNWLKPSEFIPRKALVEVTEQDLFQHPREKDVLGQDYLTFLQILQFTVTKSTCTDYHLYLNSQLRLLLMECYYFSLVWELLRASQIDCVLNPEFSPRYACHSRESFLHSILSVLG